MKRKLDTVVISDVHLGSYVSRANELNEYLKTIDARTLIINGDFLDIWHLKMRFLPPAHIKVIRRILKLLKNDSRVIYLPGNHDEALRQYGKVEVGPHLLITDEFVVNSQHNKALVFHGDIFDHTTKGSGKFIAKLGTRAYHLLFGLNRAINWILTLFSKDGKTKPLSFARKLAQRNNKAVAKLIEFEKNAAQFASARGFDTVIVGHSHLPMDEIIDVDGKKVRYLNSGDWMEHMTSLELSEDGVWSLHYYDGNRNITFNKDIDVEDWNKHQDDIAAIVESLKIKDTFNKW